MSQRAVAGTLGGAILIAVFVSWLDNRIDRRVEQGIASAVRAIVESQRAEINRIRAAIAAEIADEQQGRMRSPQPENNQGSDSENPR